jgi:hypothetical protein
MMEILEPLHEEQCADPPVPSMSDYQYQYQDRSQVTEQQIQAAMVKKVEQDQKQETTAGDKRKTSSKANSNRGRSKVPFPFKLHDMLEGLERDGLSHIVHWQPHGRAFLVRKPKAFVEQVIPKYFKQSKLTSFQRQLNLYGFRRISTSVGPDRGAYYHEYFLRGREYLSKLVLKSTANNNCKKKCDTIGSSSCVGRKNKLNPDLEPNLYNFPFVVHFLDVAHTSTGHHSVPVPSSAMQVVHTITPVRKGLDAREQIMVQPIPLNDGAQGLPLLPLVSDAFISRTLRLFPMPTRICSTIPRLTDNGLFRPMGPETCSKVVFEVSPDPSPAQQTEDLLPSSVWPHGKSSKEEFNDPKEASLLEQSLQTDGEEDDDDEEEDDDTIVLTFEGMKFHYLEPMFF